MKSLISEKQRALSQFFTPQWVASAIIDNYFSDLTSEDLVAEPACGSGSFLAALPSSVPAFGVEIDPDLVPLAKAKTGRDIICGDFRTVELPGTPTAMVGNPPFKSAVFVGMMDRAHQLLPEGGKA